MAKSKGPLFSLNAHGTLKKTLNYTRRKEGQKIRKYNKPERTPTPKQRAKRRVFEFIAAQWQAMNEAEKNTWRNHQTAKDLKISGYMYFLKEAQANLYKQTGLVAYLHFNEIIEGEVLDISGNENNGILKPDYPSNAPLLTDSKSRKLGAALKFDGVDKVVETTNNNNMNTINNFTADCWIYIKKFVNHSCFMFGKETVPSEFTFFLHMDTGHHLQLTIRTSTETYYSGDTEEVELNKWYNVTGTYNGSKAKIYLNGELKNEGIATGTIIETTRLDIGRDSRYIDRYFNGIIDEVCLYNRAMSAEEIKKRYLSAIKRVKK